MYWVKYRVTAQKLSCRLFHKRENAQEFLDILLLRNKIIGKQAWTLYTESSLPFLPVEGKLSTTTQ